MIEITTGSLEERVIKFLQKNYPATVADLKDKLRISKPIILRILQKLQIKGIVELEPLPDKTYIRLLRNDFSFVGKKRQRKFIKRYSGKKKQRTQEQDTDSIMYL
jgi:DNA-binding MarR family transcriptional regulator